MKYDDLIEHLGELGPYQVRVYILTCLPVIAVSMQTLIPVFILAVPEHRCIGSDWSNGTYSAQDVLHLGSMNATLPWDTDGHSGETGWPGIGRCDIRIILQLLSLSIQIYRRTTDGDTRQDQVFNTTKPCSHWVYDKSVFQNTFVTEMDLVCERSSLRSHANMAYMAGFLVGSIVFGIFADAKGRKLGLMIGITMHLVTSVIVVISANYVIFIICRFFIGVSNMGIELCAFVLCMELVGRPWRTVAGVTINFFWCAGMLLLDLLAYGLRDWKALQLAASCYTVLFLPLWWLVPESSRWLMNKGRVEEARVILTKIAESNKKEIPEGAFSDQDKVEEPGRITEIFFHPVLAFRAVVVFLNWLIVNFVYYGLTLNVATLGGSIYLNFALNGLVEILGNVATLAALPRLGRKRFHSLSMLFSAAACLCCMIPALVGSSAPFWTIILLSNIGKLAITGGYSTIYVFSAELFPTGLRNSVLGCCSMVARVGGMIAPYVADLSLDVDGALGSALPFVVFGSSGMIAGLLTLTLPETLNKALPETIQDAIEFGKKRPASPTNRQEQSTNGNIVECSLQPDPSGSICHSHDTHKPTNEGYTEYTNQAFEMAPV